MTEKTFATIAAASWVGLVVAAGLSYCGARLAMRS